MAYDIDPELATVIEGMPTMGFDDPAAMREMMTAGLAVFAGTIDESSLDIDDRTIPAPAGAPEVPVRIYRPKQLAQTTAGLLYIHGGGFAAGDLDSEHGVAVQCARELGIVVVSVGYRLAPEHPFPAGLEDCYAALQWFHANTTELQVDPQRIAIRGGWLHTGDVGRLDDDGFLYIVDRKKDMVVTGGFNVFPREVEDVLSAHDAVAQVAVVGVPDEKWGEAVKAVIVLKPGKKTIRAQYWGDGRAVG